MDVEMRESIKALERGMELAQEEAMHGERKAGVLQMANEAADLDVDIAALRKKVFSAKVQAGVLVALTVVVLLARLLF